MKRFLLVLGFLLPFQASALEFRNLSLLYTDAPFLPAEAAGISLLTSVDAIEGNPDGTFRPSRSINRAEFLKIVLLSHPKIRMSSSDAGRCFPDVKKDDWFSPYVCLAKKRDMVAGYPDGTFKPERTVNYAEALKILSELYEYVAYSGDDEEWYAGYVRAAKFHKTTLPIALTFDQPLTRGQMARLAAAFRAEHEGELEKYRLSEKNFDAVIAMEIAEKVSEEEAEDAEEPEAEEPQEEEVPTVTVYPFPARSHHLLLGASHLIASGMVRPRSESVTIENVTVKLREESKTIKSLTLVDEQGVSIASLKRDTFDPDDRTWKAQGDAVTRYTLPAEGKNLGVVATIKARDKDGFAQEIIEVKWMSITVRPGGGTTTYSLIATDTAYPVHQTVQATIESIRNNKPPISDLKEGDDQVLAELEISGSALEGALLRIKHLFFTLTESRGVEISHWKLGSFHTLDVLPCSVSSSTEISCLNIPEAIGLIDTGSVFVELRGDITLDEEISDPELKIDLMKPGSISIPNVPGVSGAVHWSDGSGDYTWMEGDTPLVEGSVWK